MKELKLISLRRSSLEDLKLRQLNLMNDSELQELYGGSHKIGDKCTLCADDQCDNTYTNGRG